MSRDVCYICGNKNRDVLEEHHIVPRRFGGSDKDKNLVQLCSNCHTSLERLYDQRFYDKLGVEVPDDDGEQVVCYEDRCTSKNATRVEGDGGEIWICPRHRTCAIGRCYETAKNLKRVASRGHALLCDGHTYCEDGGCGNNSETLLIGNQSKHYDVLCETHAQERGFLE